MGAAPVPATKQAGIRGAAGGAIVTGSRIFENPLQRTLTTSTAVKWVARATYGA